MRGDAVIGFMDRFGDKVYNSYNATEAGLISIASPADLRHAPDTAGKPVVGTRCGSSTTRTARCRPATSAGSWCAALQFDGYTAGDTKAFLDDYMVSGDVGRVDEAGRLYVVGRDDDMIVSGGENVYPLEVEERSASSPRSARSWWSGSTTRSSGSGWRRTSSRRSRTPSTPTTCAPT